jgi:hypothetical protein
MTEHVFLPRADAAEISDEKLRDYVLNPEHPLGRHKARVFAATLGIGRDDWAYLRDQIHARLAESPITPASLGTMLKPLDVVKLRVGVDSWEAGTTGTVLEVTGDSALVEVSDEQGRTVDTVAAPLDALRRVDTPDQRRLAV